MATRRRRKVTLKLAGTPEEIAAARAAQAGPKAPTAPPQVSRATMVSALFATPRLGQERLTPPPRIPAVIGETEITPGGFSRRGPRYRRALRQLNPEATFEDGSSATRPLQWRGRHDAVRPEVVQFQKDLSAQPGSTGIKKMANLEASRLAAAQPPAPQPLQPLRKEERAGIQQALNSVRGDPAKLKKLIDSLDAKYTPESLAPVDGWTAYKTVETAEVQVESKDELRLRHIKENMALVDEARRLGEGGDERAAQMTLEGLDLDTLNPRMRGQVEEILQSPILTWQQKVEEIAKAIRFGTTGKKTPAEEEAEAGRKEQEAAAKVEEKETAARGKEEKSGALASLKIDMEEAKEELAVAEKALVKAEAKNATLDVLERSDLTLLEQAVEDKQARVKEVRNQQRALLRGVEEIPAGPGGEQPSEAMTPSRGSDRAVPGWPAPVGAAQPVAEYSKIKADVQAAIGAGTDPMAVLEGLPENAISDEQAAELAALVGRKPTVDGQRAPAAAEPAGPPPAGKTEAPFISGPGGIGPLTKEEYEAAIARAKQKKYGGVFLDKGVWVGKRGYVSWTIGDEKFWMAPDGTKFRMRDRDMTMGWGKK